MDKTLRILVIEDCQADFLLMVRHLKQHSPAADCFCAAGMEELLGALDRGDWDIVLADYNLPGLNFLECLHLIQARRPDLPVILVSGTVGEEKAIELLKQGVWDFVLKNNLGRLAPAIERSLREAADRRARRAAETALRETHEKLRQLLAHSPAVLYTLEIDGEELSPVVVSDNIERLLGFSVTECSSYAWWINSLHPEDCNRVLAVVEEAIKKGQGYSLEYRLRDREGVYHWVEDNSRILCHETGRQRHAVGVWADITRRKQAEEALRESEKAATRLAKENELIAEIGRIIGSTLNIEEVYERFAEKVNEAIPFDRIAVNTFSMKDCTRTVRYVKDDRFSGHRIGEVHSLVGTVAEYIFRTKSSLVINSENREDMMRKLSGIPSLKFGAQSTMIIPLISEDEVIGALAIHSLKIDAYSETTLHLAERMGSQIAGAIANAQLFLDLKRAKEELNLMQMQLLTILESTCDGILAVDNAGRVIKTNQRFGDIWKIPSDLFEKGSDEVLLTYVLGQLVDPDAFLKKVHELYASTAVDYDTISFKDGRIIERYSCPLLSEGVINGRVWSFRDVTERKKTEESLKETLKKLRKAINTTMQVILSAVETRDPYTAGHQIRTADLSRAIATEMGLPQEKIEGIRIVGTIHDIGKLSIPAEILSKPTKLTEIEFSLIKEHACKGFEILKDVESPWPLAEIVFQHHERMDGSGYPQGLKGDEILLEARIIAVADVVESMASHRPYRPMLGVEAALEEIEKNKGVLYDAAVVEQCLRLFQEKGFKF